MARGRPRPAMPTVSPSLPQAPASADAVRVQAQAAPTTRLSSPPFSALRPSWQVTLFHEFGHVAHQILARTQLSAYAGAWGQAASPGSLQACVRRPQAGRSV